MATLPFETQISQALADNAIPGVVLRAKSKDGRIDYTKSIGPWDTTTIFPLASTSKLITCIAAAQAIAQGLITLDKDVTPLLPTLAAQPILTGFDSDGKPLLKRRQKAITFRHLLTHSYGQTYSVMDPDLTGQYLKTHGLPAAPIDGSWSVEETFNYPLLSEPGDAWVYGPGIDWAGRVIEKLSGVSLEEFMRVNIFAPLGITDMTFFPGSRPGMVERIARLSVRDKETGKSVPAPPEVTLPDPARIQHCLGGAGLFASIDEYLKVVESILAEDEKLLKKEDAAELLFQRQIPVEGNLELPETTVGWVPHPNEGYTWSLAGLLSPTGRGHRGHGTTESGHRGSDFLQWGGMYNSAWVRILKGHDVDWIMELTDTTKTCSLLTARPA